jgi:hypothetical protein
MMPVVDEYTRECLSIDVERSITAEDVVSTLASLFGSRGEPAFIRSDNGPEFVAKAHQAVAGGLRGRDPLHRAGISVGERLLGDVHKPLFGRTAKEGTLRRSLGSEGADRRLPRTLQPQKTTQRIGLPDPSTIRRGRGSREEGGGWPEARGARIGTHTLIAPGTENGVRPRGSTALGVLSLHSDAMCKQ